MGKTKKTRKFAVAKRMISPKDTRVAENAEKKKLKDEERRKKAEPRQVEQAVSALFFEYNTQLGPPYQVLVDTNFINFSIRYVQTTDDEVSPTCFVFFFLLPDPGRCWRRSQCQCRSVCTFVCGYVSALSVDNCLSNTTTTTTWWLDVNASSSNPKHDNAFSRSDYSFIDSIPPTGKSWISSGQ